MPVQPPSSSPLEQWLDDRFKISILKKWLGKKEVPQHNQSMWYYFGGIAMFFFVIQVLTGLLLLVYYQPGLETSHASVKFITDKVEFGWLVRSMHSWAANMMVAVLFIHMFSAFFMKAFRAPREFTWLTGFLLFVITLGLGFSGYLLPWDELSYFATKIGIQIMASTPVVGGILADLLRGGEEVGGATISRFFELHIILLPAALVALLGLHLLMVQVHGMSKPYSFANKPARYRKSIPFFTEFLYHDIIIWSVLMGFLVFVAWNFPWSLGPEADPFKPAPVGIKPEWYFMFMFQALKQLPAHIGPFEGEVVGILFFGVAGALWALVPFYEGLNKTVSKLVSWAGVFALVFIVGMTSWGYLADLEAPMEAGTSTTESMLSDTSGAKNLFEQNCAACHSIGKGVLVGPDLKGITQKRDKEQLASFIANPEGSKMPAIPGIDKVAAAQILDYIDQVSNPKKESPVKTAAEKPQEVPFTPEQIENGKKLFVGIKPLAKGGPACISCHAAGSATSFEGGNLGTDLTMVYSRFGGRAAMTAWLGSIPSLTMKPVYQGKELSKAEIEALTAFFEAESKNSQSKAPAESFSSKKSSFFIFGVLGMLVVLFILSAVYRNRLTGVRAGLLKESSDDNE